MIILYRIAAALFANKRYDLHTPDTRANRAGFRRHFGLDAPPEVKGIYYYADGLGADAVFQLRFMADSAMAESVTRLIGLSKASPCPDSSLARNDLEWWPTDRLKTLVPSWKVNARQNHFQMLWYDCDTNETFYLEFTL